MARITSFFENRIKLWDLRIPFSSRLKLFLLSSVDPFLRLLKLGGPGIAVEVGGKKVMIHNSTDLGTFLEVFLHQEYRLPGTAEPIKHILDLGANRGYTSIYFAEKFKDAKTVAIEASPVNFEKLRMNIAGYAGRCSPEQAAIASKTGTMDFYLNFGNNISGSLIARDVAAEKISVPAVTLADLEKKYGAFDLVKFDIEGGEWDAVLPNMLAHPPAIWIGEYHEDIVGRPEAEFLARFGGYAIVSRKIASKRSLIVAVKG